MRSKTTCRRGRETSCPAYADRALAEFLTYPGNRLFNKFRNYDENGLFYESTSYDDPLYHAYYCQSDAHNVLTVGDRGSRAEELYRGTKFPGAIIDKCVGRDLVFMQADATGPMAHLTSRMFRNFIWIENRLLVIVDDVFCHEADTVQFTLHYNGTYRQTDGAVYFEYEDRRIYAAHHAQ